MIFLAKKKKRSNYLKILPKLHLNIEISTKNAKHFCSNHEFDQNLMQLKIKNLLTWNSYR